MRIFKQLCMDLKGAALFKDTIDYIEEAFKKLNIKYDNMGFMFSMGPVDKVAEKYPVLTKYIRTVDEHGSTDEQAMSSARIDKNGNYTLRVDEEEHQIMHELVKKTPRPFNFGAISVFWITYTGFLRLTLHRV